LYVHIFAIITPIRVNKSIWL